MAWSIALYLAVCSAANATPPPRSAFLQQPLISAVTLAPDGDAVAWLAREGTRQAVWLQTLDGSPARRAMAHTAARELAYTRDGRWLLLAAPTQLFALAVAGQSGSGLLTTLGPDSQWRVDHTAAAGITLLDQSKSSWRLQRIAVGGPTQLLHADAQHISGYALAADGGLAWLQRVEGLALALYRYPAMREVQRCTKLQRCTPIADLDGQLLQLSNDLADDPLGLARLLRLDPAGRSELIARDPAGEADLDALVLDPQGRPRLLAYHSTRAQLAAIDAADQAVLERMRQHFPEHELRPQIGRSRWLVEVRHPSQPGTGWYLLQPDGGPPAALFEDAGAPAVGIEQRPTTWTASDGMRLHGFLTTPPGDPASMPLVVLAHGGPWSHWQPRYNPLAQFIATRGAIVFEPNHRGSTGHGLAYLMAARGDYGYGRVQQDIDEGVRSLLAQGIGQPDRVAIVGASFGGYAALLGVTFAPELYRTAVAFVPPTDFGWTLQWILRNAESLRLDRLVPMADWLRMLELDVDDATQMARLRAQSPLANVHRLRRPLLIVAGAADERVGIAGVIEYVARARIAGKDVRLLIDHDAGHRQRHDTAREANLYLIESMLHEHLGLPAPAPPDALLARYLQNHLKRS